MVWKYLKNSHSSNFDTLKKYGRDPISHIFVLTAINKRTHAILTSSLMEAYKASIFLKMIIQFCISIHQE